MVLKLVPVGGGGLLASVFRSWEWMEGQRLGKVPGWELMGWASCERGSEGVNGLYELLETDTGGFEGFLGVVHDDDGVVIKQLSKKRVVRRWVEGRLCGDAMEPQSNAGDSLSKKEWGDVMWKRDKNLSNHITISSGTIIVKEFIMTIIKHSFDIQ